MFFGTMPSTFMLGFMLACAAAGPEDARNQGAAGFHSSPVIDIDIAGLADETHMGDLAVEPFDAQLAADLQAAISMSKDEKDFIDAMIMEEQRALQSILAATFPEYELDVNTPRDGHCLFHSLNQGGMFSQLRESLTLQELRAMVLTTATQEQLALAASQQGYEINDYIEAMKSTEYGDELVIVHFAFWPRGLRELCKLM